MSCPGAGRAEHLRGLEVAGEVAEQVAAGPDGGPTAPRAGCRDVDFTVEVDTPLSPDGTPAKIWERRFHHATGHQAWEIVISADESKELIQVVPSTWQAARASLVHLPADVAGPDHLTEPDVQASPQFELHRPQ